jgi:fibronectin type 3 domain-containing protein
VLITEPANILGYQDTGLAASTQYFYEAYVTTASGNSPLATGNATTSTAALTQVTNLSVTGTTTSSISLTWTAVSGATGYSIERNGSVVGTTAGNNTFTDTGLASSTTYTYNVAATNLSGTGPYSTPVNGTTNAVVITVPPQVTGLSVTGTTTSSVSLSWSADSGATSYTVERNGAVIASGIASTTYTDSGLSSSTSYTYNVAGVNSAGIGAYSSSVVGTTNTIITVPPQVTGLAVLSVTTSTVSLSWNADAGATSYTIERNGSVVATGITPTTFTDSGLSPSTAYTYNVAAVNSAGTGPYSSSVVAATSTAASTSTLLSYLQGLPTGTSNRILSGQHLDYFTGTSQTPYDDFTSGTNAATANIAGAVPAVIGVSVQGPDNGPSPTEQTIGGAAGVVALANDWLSHGGIVHVSSWPGNPASNVFGALSNGGDLTPCFSASNGVLVTGSTIQNNWLANCDTLAALLKQMNGEVIYRPFVEINGNWNWWGYGGYPGGPTAAQFQALWTLTRNRMIADGVTNVLWNYNCNANVGGSGSYTAGLVSGQTDIVSFDVYSDTPGSTGIINGCYSSCVATGLPVIISEIGNGSSSASDSTSYGTCLQNLKANCPNVVAWVNWCQGWSLANNSGASVFMTDPWIITRNELPSFKVIPGTPTDAQLIANYPAASYNGYNATTSDLGSETSNGVEWIINSPPTSLLPAGVASAGFTTPLWVFHPTQATLQLNGNTASSTAKLFGSGYGGLSGNMTGLPAGSISTVNGQLTLTNTNGSNSSFPAFQSVANSGSSLAGVTGALAVLPAANGFYIQATYTETDNTAGDWTAWWVWCVEKNPLGTTTTWFEMDVDEAPGNGGGMFSTIHYWDPSNTQVQSANNVASNRTVEHTRGLLFDPLGKYNGTPGWFMFYDTTTPGVMELIGSVAMSASNYFGTGSLATLTANAVTNKHYFVTINVDWHSGDTGYPLSVSWRKLEAWVT